MAAQDFYNTIYRDARGLGANHVQASIAAAQSAIETGWGKDVKGNSYFGFKAGRYFNGKTQVFDTHETINGVKTPMKDKFRAFDTRQESVADYVKEMKIKFSKTWKAETINEAAANLAHGRYGAYATDPTYPDDVAVTARKRSPAAKRSYDGVEPTVKPDKPKATGKRTTLRRKDKGADVTLLLNKLQERGYYDGPLDDVFGGGAEAAVLHFQEDAGLLVDGIAGPATRKTLASWTAKASERIAFDRSGFHYTNQWATRNLPISVSIENAVVSGVAECFGPNCRIQCYSGGQPRKGTSGKRTGSIRHDIVARTKRGRAGDFHIFKPNGRQITGLELGKLGQWWLANKLGSCGLEMSGGGIHLDNWTTPPPGGSNYWTYKASDRKSYGTQLRRMLSAGKAGRMPELYKAPPKPPAPLPKPVQAVLDDADKTGLNSSTNGAVGIGGIATSVLAAKPIIDAVNETKDGVSALLDAGPWVIAIIAVAGAGFYIWRERSRKAKLAQKAKAALL